MVDAREIYSGSDLLEGLGVENLHFKSFCRMSPSDFEALINLVHSMFRTSAESRLIKARHRPHDSGGVSRTPLMYGQQAEPHEPVARAARIACLVTCHIVHITREHSKSHEHENGHE
jgi:hypothetical protein